MVISTKCFSMHSKLHAQLIEPVRRLASEFYKIENRCVGFVQALLLLCSWPFPFNVSINDMSWMFCGMATHMALQLGLHRPHHQTEFVYRPQHQPEFGPNLTPNESENSVRRIVWAGCYIVNHRYVCISMMYLYLIWLLTNWSTSVSSMIGVPATVSCDHAIIEVMGSSALVPETIHHQLQIANAKDRVSRLLGQNNQLSSGLRQDPTPFIRILNEELDLLASQQRANWGPEIKITFICARLRLYSFAFLQDIIEEPDVEITRVSARTEFSTSAYLAATELTTIASSRSSKAIFWTAEIWACIVYAAMFLLRLWERSKIYGLEETSIRSAVTQLRSLIAENSRENDDHLARVCAIIDYLSRDGYADIPLRRPLKFHSRLSSNLVFDTVWHAKERFNLAKANQLPNDDMSAINMEDWMLSYFEEEQGFPMAEGLGWGI